MIILLVAVAQIAAGALCSVAVRAQLSLFRGFDVMVAAVVTIASEITCAMGIAFPALGWYGAAAAFIVAAALTSLLMIGWNRFVAVWIGESRNRGTALLILSLFCTTAITGLVGLARGPGLVPSPWADTASILADGSLLTLGTLFGCVMALGLPIGLIVWRRSRAGFALELWAQDRDLACEVGIAERGLVRETGILAALVASAVGVWSALSNGSTPDIGLEYFLTGTAGALLFSGPALWYAAAGGALVGLTTFGLQFALSPSQTNMVVFVSIGVFLIARGSARLEQNVR